MENRNGLRMVMKIVMGNILVKLKMGNKMEQELSHLLMEVSILGNGRMEILIVKGLILSQMERSM